MVHGLPMIKLPIDMCKNYLTSKQPRKSFVSHIPMRAKLDDVSGPFDTLSL